MQTQIAVIVVRDRHGGIAVDAAQDPDSLIGLGRTRSGLMVLRGMDGRPVCYEGRAGGVEGWAVENGMEYEQHILELDLSARKVLKWTYQPK